MEILINWMIYNVLIANTNLNIKLVNQDRYNNYLLILFEKVIKF
jgi:hypothetical protein